MSPFYPYHRILSASASFGPPPAPAPGARYVVMHMPPALVAREHLRLMLIMLLLLATSLIHA